MPNILRSDIIGHMTKKVQSSKIKDQKVEVVKGNFLNTILGKFSVDNIKNYRPSRNVYIVLVIAGVLLLATLKKDLFVAAMVNGQPIFNLELQGRLNQQFRAQTLDQMVSEKIILYEANKNKALATETEVNAKIAEIETSVGGVQAFNNLLSQQGQTMENVKKQLRIQLSIENLYAKDATVSADEINQYLQTNQEILSATDSASQEKEAMTALKQQKLSQTFQQKFQGLRQAAKIQIF